MNFLFFTFVTALSFPASNAIFSSLFDYFDNYYDYEDSVPSDNTFDFFDPFDFTDIFHGYPESDEKNVTEIKNVEVQCDGCNIKINCTNCTVEGLPPTASLMHDSTANPIQSSTSAPTSTSAAPGSGSTSPVAQDATPSAASTQTEPTTVSAPTDGAKVDDSIQENSMTTIAPQSNSIEVNSTEASTETTTAGTK